LVEQNYHNITNTNTNTNVKQYSNDMLSKEDTHLTKHLFTKVNIPRGT